MPLIPVSGYSSPGGVQAEISQYVRIPGARAGWTPGFIAF